MKKKETGIEGYTDVFNSLEALYVDEKYQEIVKLRDEYPESVLFDVNREEYSLIVEIFSGSYIELDMLKDALTLVNNHIEFIKERGFEDTDGMDDLSAFFQFKIIIYQKKKELKKEYRTTKEYISLGGISQDIIDNKTEVEDIIFSRFFMANKILIGLALLVIILKVILSSVLQSSYISIITSLIVIWVLLIHVFHKKTRKLLTKLFMS